MTNDGQRIAQYSFLWFSVANEIIHDQCYFGQEYEVDLFGDVNYFSKALNMKPRITFDENTSLPRKS